MEATQPQCQERLQSCTFSSADNATKRLLDAYKVLKGNFNAHLRVQAETGCNNDAVVALLALLKSGWNGKGSNTLAAHEQTLVRIIKHEDFPCNALPPPRCDDWQEQVPQRRAARSGKGPRRRQRSSSDGSGDDAAAGHRPQRSKRAKAPSGASPPPPASDAEQAVATGLAGSRARWEQTQRVQGSYAAAHRGALHDSSSSESERGDGDEEDYRPCGGGEDYI